MKTYRRIVIFIISLTVLVILPFSELYHELVRAWHNFNYWSELKGAWNGALRDGYYHFKIGKFKEDQDEAEARIKKRMDEF